jgi:uroporphyrin-3 C-methyltransferase
VTEGAGGATADKETDAAAPSSLDERVARALASGERLEHVLREPASPPPATAAPVVRRDAGARATATLALLLALGACALGAWNYFYPNVKPPDLGDVRAALGSAGSALSDAQSSMARLDGEIAGMRERIDELATAQAGAAQEIETLRNQTMETVEAMQRLATGDAFTSNRWIRAEAEHLLQSANIALDLNHDAATALAALEAADERLAELNDPALTRTRALLAEEIAALRALPKPDLAGIALTLGSLAARVELLPLPQAETAETPAPAGSAWQRAVARVGAALSGLVSIERTDGGGAPVLPPEERFFLYRNLELELESARLAALRGDAANYAQSLASARRWLETRFAQDDPGVQSALAAITELSGIQLVATWPEISGSLNELRSAPQQ